MATTLKKPRAPEGRFGVWQPHIPGRFRKISVHQLVLAWWLFRSKHINKRQLRVYFALHEMAERRSYTRPRPGGQGGRAQYTVDELRSLIGGSRTAKSDANLRSEIRALGRLGLVNHTGTNINFATSIDQIRLDDVSDFWAMFAHFDHPRRQVAMPRRTCRALAGGFPTSVMAMMLALVIRSLFWHRPGQTVGEGGYRIDGRTKCSWIADVFGVSRRSVTEARAKLIELGWITPLDAPQWALNRWGQRYQISVEAFGPASPESASLSQESSRQTACLRQNSSTSSSRNLITRRPGEGPPATPDPRAVFLKTGPKGRRKKPPVQDAPTLHNITAEDLRDTNRLLALHDQAAERGIVNGSEAGRHDFLALAERARSQGHSPCRLFAWLLTRRRFEFITTADEEAASSRLREYRNGPRSSRKMDAIKHSGQVTWNDDERFVLACLRVAEQTRHEPWQIAREGRGWSQEQWEAARQAVEQKDRDRWILASD